MVHAIWGGILFFSIWGAFVAGLAWEYIHWSKEWNIRMRKLEKDSLERDKQLDAMLKGLNDFREGDLEHYIDIGGEG